MGWPWKKVRVTTARAAAHEIRNVSRKYAEIGFLRANGLIIFAVTGTVSNFASFPMPPQMRPAIASAEDCDAGRVRHRPGARQRRRAMRSLQTAIASAVRP